MLDCGDGHERGLIEYAPWGVEEIERFCKVIAPTCRGWVLSITDDLLGPWWRHHLRETAHLHAFQGVPAIVPGSRFRKQGDGPPCVSYLCYAARPKTLEFCGGWTPAGYYLADPEPSARGKGEPLDQRLRGEKPVGLMTQIIRDYVRGVGQWVLDPCAGRGATIAAARLGHHAIGIEKDPKTFDLLCKRLRADGIAFVAHRGFSLTKPSALDTSE